MIQWVLDQLITDRVKKGRIIKCLQLWKKSAPSSPVISSGTEGEIVMAGGAVKAIKQFAMGIQATIGVIYNTKPIIVQRWTFFTAVYY